jgi:hypothetical protein
MCNKNYKFQLSGLGNVALEIKVCEAVQQSSYSDQELNDIKEPVQYNFIDLTSNLDFNNIKQKLLSLQYMASLTPNIVFSNRITNIKTFIKRIFAKFFRWYVDPIFASQSLFNLAASSLISEFLFFIQTQEDKIIRLQKELKEK